MKKKDEAKPLFPVSLPALMARINRKLAHEDQQLRATRGLRARSDFGDYYIVDRSRNSVVDTRVKPVALARELGVMTPWEFLEGGR